MTHNLKFIFYFVSAISNFEKKECLKQSKLFLQETILGAEFAVM